MALDCGPHTWKSCLSTASSCETSDPGYEGTMDIDTPDPHTGDFEGWFYPADGSQRRKITGKCKEQSFHMTLERVDAGGKKHKYKGDRDGDHVRGHHTNTREAKDRKEPPTDDDEWIATKVT
jgi:hypothetical protein